MPLVAGVEDQRSPLADFERTGDLCAQVRPAGGLSNEHFDGVLLVAGKFWKTVRPLPFAVDEEVLKLVAHGPVRQFGVEALSRTHQGGQHADHALGSKRLGDADGARNRLALDGQRTLRTVLDPQL